MISRAVFLAACFAAAAGVTYNLQCTPASAVCGGKCCGVSWTLGGTDGSFTCTKKGAAETCGLCGQDGLEKCAFTMENSGAPAAELVDTHGNTVEVSASVSSGTGRLQPTRPSSGVTMTLGTYSGMNGWFDIPASSFNGFTEFLLGLTATVPSFYTDTGFTVRYSCRKPHYGAPAGFKGCNIFFFVYKCPPCQRLDAGIHAKLLAMDEPRWFAGQCGPTFKLNRDLGADHGFAVWQADIEDGSVVSMTMDSPIEFIFWAMVGKSVVCSARLTEANCDAAPDNCEWTEEGVCRPRGCPKPSPFHGAPTPKCQVCVDDEEEFIPRVIV